MPRGAAPLGHDDRARLKRLHHPKPPVPVDPDTFADMAPPPPPFNARLQRLHAELSPITSGELASYIPELSRADPNSFGLAITTVDGDSLSAGEAQQEFSIQSVSKPFVYAMALLDKGEDFVLEHVGIEPTGDPFNAVTLSESTGKPLNPMVNAGAIVTSSLVAGASPGDRIDRIVSGLSQFAGRRLAIDPAVQQSETRTSDRNRAISYLMRGAGSLELEVEDALTGYIAQCSVLITTTDLAVMAATLADGGRNPITDEQVIPPELITHVLTIMATCGMYDGAGEWMYRVGLPAKSGVSGAIMSVLPNQVGLAAWSPPLDSHGNSVRGVLAMEKLSDDLDLHVFYPTGPPQSPIRRITTSQVLRARTGRTIREQAVLDEHGSAIRIVQLRGAITLLAAQSVVRALSDAEHEEETWWLVLDDSQVAYFHPGAQKLVGEALQALADSGVSVRIVERAADGSDTHHQRSTAWQYPTLTDTDIALQEAEDELIARHSGAAAIPETAVPLTECQVLEDLTAQELAVVEPHLAALSFSTGEVIKAAGAEMDGASWVLAGEVDMLIPVAGVQESTRLRGIGPGGSFGEISLVQGGFELGRVVATQPTRLVHLPLSAWEQIGAREPAVAQRLLEAVARVLAARQYRLMELLVSMAETRTG